MKKLDKLLIKSFIGPFIVTFMIATFVLLMQFLWLYVDDLAGKGLGMLIVFELLGYKCVGLIPMAMPLAILISSVMVFGNMGERYELSSFKSGGISLARIMAPIIFLGAVGSLFSYFSNNYLIPVSNLKFGSRMYDIQHQKPALNLEAGVFNDDFDGFAIHISEKLPDGNTIKDVLIYDHRDASSGLLREIAAKEGEMYADDNDKYFVLNLKDGNQYVEQKSASRKGKNKGQTYPFIRTKFKRWTKLFDMGEFNLKESDQDVFKKHHKMLNISQLAEAVDSIGVTLDKKRVNLSNHFSTYISTLDRDSTYVNEMASKYDRYDDLPPKIESAPSKEDSVTKPVTAVDTAKTPGKSVKTLLKESKTTTKQPKVNTTNIPSSKSKTKNSIPPKSRISPSTVKQKSKAKFRGPEPMKQNLDSLESFTSLIQTFDSDDHKRLFSKAKTSIRSIRGQAVSAVRTIGDIRETRVKYIFDLHTKYSMAVVCFIFVFIGAPMGAIVRKGGFGYPILISIVFFILFIVLTIFCKKVAESFVLDPVLAAWLPGIVLFPIGLILTIKAMNDSKLLDPDRVINFVKKWINKKAQDK
jgi:lipopolysaccharide export system permease protein